MSTIPRAPFACTKSNPAAIASVKTVQKYQHLYIEEAEENGAKRCTLKIARFGTDIMEYIDSMCQLGYQDETITKNTSVLIAEMREQSANCISSEIAKKQQAQQDTADKMKKTLSETEMNFSPITLGAYALKITEVNL